MVQVRYKGQNFLYVDGYKIQAGWNEIKDNDFYKMMKTKTFKFRVESGVLEVEKGFPLEKPESLKKPDPSTETSGVMPDDSDKKDEGQAERLSIKGTLKLIEKSEDAEYLQSLIDSDGRQHVIEEAKKKLKTLK